MDFKINFCLDKGWLPKRKKQPKNLSVRPKKKLRKTWSNDHLKILKSTKEKGVTKKKLRKPLKKIS